jgi:hypothetical protein
LQVEQVITLGATANTTKHNDFLLKITITNYLSVTATMGYLGRAMNGREIGESRYPRMDFLCDFHQSAIND